MNLKRTKGLWILVIGGVLLLIELFAGQLMALIDYEFAVSLGLQESNNVVGAMGVAFNKGFGVGDGVIYVPLLCIGLTGILLRKPWGAFAMFGAMAITAYWPVVCLFFLFFAKGASGFYFDRYGLYAVILVATCIYGLWGMWYTYRHRAALGCLV